MPTATHYHDCQRRTAIFPPPRQLRISPGIRIPLRGVRMPGSICATAFPSCQRRQPAAFFWQSRRKASKDYSWHLLALPEGERGYKTNPLLLSPVLSATWKNTICIIQKSR